MNHVQGINWVANFIWGIADVVSGKLDVRETVARLPDEADAPSNGADDLDSTPEEVEA